MPLSLLVGTVALSLVGHADSTRALAKPSVVPPYAASVTPADSVVTARVPFGRGSRIEARNPGSPYHRSLKISYPDAAHRARARSLGVSPGGDIMIHGLPARQAWVGAAHRDFDWTSGCIAVTNKEIDEIWGAVPVGTPILIKP